MCVCVCAHTLNIFPHFLADISQDVIIKESHKIREIVYPFIRIQVFKLRSHKMDCILLRMFLMKFYFSLFSSEALLKNSIISLIFSYCWYTYNCLNIGTLTSRSIITARYVTHMSPTINSRCNNFQLNVRV